MGWSHRLLTFQAASQQALFSAPNPGDGNVTSAAQVDVLDPDWDIYFTTADGHVLTRAEALATVPAGTTDVGGC